MKIFNLRLLIFVLVFLLQIKEIFGQVREIKGAVFNSETNKSISGIKVSIEGTNIFTKSNMKGEYSLSIPDSIKTVNFSRFKARNIIEVKVLSKNNIDIFLSKKDILYLSFEEIMQLQVEVASKKKENITDAPGIITVISQKEIQDFGANTLFEILHRIPSVLPVGSHLFVDNIASFRGDLETHNDVHTLILIDGRPIREGIMGGINNSIYGSFPIEIIEKIEVIRGPGSVLYGTNAYTGVINIVTKTQEKKLSLNATGAYGSFNSIYSILSAGLKNKKLEVLFSGQFLKKDGWNFETKTAHPDPAIGDTIGNMKYGENKKAIFAKIKYGNLKLITYYSDNYNDILGAVPHWQYKGTQTSQRLFTNLGYKEDISENWYSQIDLSYSNSKFQINDGDVGSQHSSNLLGEISVTGKLQHNINIITGFILDNRTQPFVIDETMPTKYSQIHYSSYLQVDYKHSRLLKIIAGMQMNIPDIGDIDFSPRIGIISYFSETSDIGIKLLYSEAFRSPWPQEQYIVHPILLGVENLAPEKIGTIDAQLFYNISHFQMAGTFFNSKFSNLISRIDTDKPGQQTYGNVGEMEITGAEFETKIIINSDLLFTASSMYQYNNQKDDDIKSLSPSFILKGGIIYDIFDDLSLGIYNTYYGKPIKSGGKELNAEAKAINLMNVNIKYKLPKIPIEISIYGQNLLDDDFIFTAFSKRWTNTLPMGAGRTIFVKMKFIFNKN